MEIKIKTDFWNHPDKFVKILYFYQVTLILFVLASPRSTFTWILGGLIFLFNLIMLKSYNKWKQEQWPLQTTHK